MFINKFILEKENNKIHSEEDILNFIQELNLFKDDDIARWLLAVKKNGLNNEELSVLTSAMAHSGEILDWSDLEPVMDKHSSGGVGDKITFLFAPLLASYNGGYIRVPKLSGRGLGITGGTIDKLESIPGLQTNCSLEQFKKQVKEINLAIASASKNLVPADKRLYAIRDVSGAVDSIPLIASSIMSKKIATGSKNIILDVKYGSGAFLNKLEDSIELANKMVSIGKRLNKKIKAVVSNMDEPLGYAVGNSLEILEVLDVLSGKDINDLVELTVILTAESIELIEGKKEIGLESKLRKLLLGGEVLKKFNEMVAYQGGDINKIGKSAYIEKLFSPCDGFITNIDAKSIGVIVHDLGAGRKRIDDIIDSTCGILFYKRHGDYVKKGDCILEVHTKSRENVINIKENIFSSITFSAVEKRKVKIVEKIIS